jgi:DNA-binding MarR family transcriptional regulator
LVTARIGYVVARLDRALRREISALLAPYNLTVSQFTALSVLGDRPGLSNAQLARRVYVTPQSMNEVLSSLQERGLIVRSPAANHGRVVEVVLSDRGAEVLAECDRRVGEMEERMLAGVDRERLRAELLSCVARLDRR